MEINENIDSTPADATQAQPSAARRKFIKSTSLALPAVVTLQSGTALAASSSGCGAKISQSYAAVLLDNYPPGDNRMREEVLLCKKLTYKKVNGVFKWTIENNASTAYFLGKKDGAATWRYEATGEPVVNTGTDPDKLELDAILLMSGNLLGKIVTLSANKIDAGAKAKFQTTTKRYAIVHVAVDGVLKGQRVAVGQPVGKIVPNAICTSWTGACLASIYGV
jgi:hypothetical protein